MRNSLIVIFLTFNFVVSQLCASQPENKREDIDTFQPVLGQYYTGEISFSDYCIQFNHWGDTISGNFFEMKEEALATNHLFEIIKDDDQWNCTLDGTTQKFRWEVYQQGNRVKGHFKIRRYVLWAIPMGWRKYSFDLPNIEKIDAPLVNRFREKHFPYRKTVDIKYGQAEGYYTSKVYNQVDYGYVITDVLSSTFSKSEEPLFLDLFQPKTNDEYKKPLLVFIHGGAFIIGDKSNETIDFLADEYASRGFVVASINYRLGFKFLPDLDKILDPLFFWQDEADKDPAPNAIERSIHRATQDARAALRYLVHHADSLGFDKNHIYVAGTSAGGFITLNLAFMDESERFPGSQGFLGGLIEDLGCLDCSSNELSDSFQLSGIINMWGALSDSAILDANEKLPILCIHGDGDEIVPFDHDYCFQDLNWVGKIFTRPVFGSSIVHERAKRFGFQSKLVNLNGYNHEPHLNPDNEFNQNFDLMKLEISNFLTDLTAPAPVPITGPVDIQHGDEIAEYSSSYPLHQTYWTIEGGYILPDQMKKSIQVVWFENANTRKLTLHIFNDIAGCRSIDFVPDIQ